MLKWTSRSAMAVGAVVFTLGVVHAQSKKVATLAARDYVEIKQLVARYAYAADTGADNGYAYADLFTPDGEFVGARGRPKGREALAEYCRTGPKPASGVSHFVMNHVIAPSADGATGKAYLILVNLGESGKGGGEFSDTGGHYEDVYAKTPQGWRIKRRQFIPSQPGS